VVVCCVVTVLGGGTKWLWILVCNSGYIASELVPMFGCTCISLYFLVDVLARVVSAVQK
jgi:hypothetical protein